MEHYLSTYQPHILQLFNHALTRNKLSHAYLLSGKPNTPLYDVALFLAKSLVCEHPQPFADLSCSTCQRIDAKDYVDLKIINGSLESIKKADVLSLEQDFSISSLEIQQKQIYILHLVETMTPEAVNALLKFLEEPQQDVYAFLTTENIESLLPTIRSRSQIIQFRPIAQTTLIHHFLAENIPEDDAQLLSFLVTTIDQANTLRSSAFYTSIKTALLKWFSLWGQTNISQSFSFREMILPLIHDEDQARLFLSIMHLLIEQTLILHHHQPLVLTRYRDVLLLLNEAIIQIKEMINLHLEYNKRLQVPVNLPLFLEAYSIELMKGLRIK